MYNRTKLCVISVDQDYIILLTSVCIPDEAFVNYITSVINWSHERVPPYFYTPYFLTLLSILSFNNFSIFQLCVLYIYFFKKKVRWQKYP